MTIVRYIEGRSFFMPGIAANSFSLSFDDLQSPASTHNSPNGNAVTPRPNGSRTSPM